VKPRYSMLIQWSDEDEAYIVTLPEFDNAKTHGDTYEEAARQGSDLIESFLMWSAQDGKLLPDPLLFVFPGDEDVDAVATSFERSVG
jgi:predicted RNase H-like HicB family nuclease